VRPQLVSLIIHPEFRLHLLHSFLCSQLRLQGLAFLARLIHVAQIDNQWSSGVVTIRVRSSVRSLCHHRWDLHQSTYLYLSKDREPTPHQVGVKFQVAHEVLSCAFSLVYYLSYRDPPKSPKIYTFHYPITFWAFANLIFKLVLLTSCPSQSHIAGLGRILDLVWVLHLVI
jgi:hypothetical protein